MGRIIAVANQKGGVGKSTTAINLSACLAEKGKKVLTIDIDPQGNTTSGLGVDKNSVENTLYELLLGEAEIKDTVLKDVVENVDLIPSNINLSGAEIELVGIDDKEFILKGITDKLRRKYDYIHEKSGSTMPDCGAYNLSRLYYYGLSAIFKYAYHQCADSSDISAGTDTV